jgi:2-phospho-L-lactate guanylyltransferase
MPDWTVVVPVKGTASAKSRFGGPADARAALARAMALDTVEAVLRARRVTAVIVVTGSDDAAQFESLGARVVREKPGAGLIGAIGVGITHAGEGNVAVLLGDIPALDHAELDAALAAAADVERAMVPDAEGTGTVLTTARAGVQHVLAFGSGSNAAHRAAGYVPLDVPATSGLRRDIDTPEQLASLPPAELGPRTRALVERRG